MIEVCKTRLKNVLLIKPEFFEDHRGEYLELYNKELYKTKGIDIDFVEDDISIATTHVLKGIHGDDRTWKLVTCLLGKFYITVVNCDEQSPNFGQWESFVLTKENGRQVLVPPKHGHAYVVLSDNAIFHYKQSCYYEGMQRQFTYKYNDPRFKIWWPIKNPIVSQRDEP